MKHGRTTPMKGGDEYDALSKRSRKFLSFGRKALKIIKRRYNKRNRRRAKNEIEDMG